MSYLINKGREITSDTTLTEEEGVYIVTGSTVVSASSTLTIEPGVSIRFYEGDTRFGEEKLPTATLDVKGVLNAVGAPNKPVFFGSFWDTPAGSIIFESGTATSTLSDVQIDNLHGIEVEGSETVLDIIDTNIVRNDAGIHIDGGARVSIASSTVMIIREGDAISVRDGSFLDIASTTIGAVRNGSAISVDESTLNVSSSKILSVLADGINLYNATSTISNTVIVGGGGDGISIEGGSVVISGTTITSFDGSGVSVSTPTEPVVLEDSKISNNNIGVSMDEGSIVLVNDIVNNNQQNVIIQ